jgi:hypothetical protein
MPAPETLDELKTLQAIPSNFSWVVADKIAGMALPSCAYQLQQLREHLGVGLVINLTSRDVHRAAARMLGNRAPQLVHASLAGFSISDLQLEYQSLVLRFVFPDYNSPDPRQLELVVVEIKNALADGHAVAIHCCGGLGRTGKLLSRNAVLHFISQRTR